MAAWMAASVAGFIFRKMHRPQAARGTRPACFAHHSHKHNKGAPSGASAEPSNFDVTD